jgi:hypothetical protein
LRGGCETRTNFFKTFLKDKFAISIGVTSEMQDLKM